MKKITQKRFTGLHKLLCAAAKRSAYSGAGKASEWGWYQHKVPEKLAK